MNSRVCQAFDDQTGLLRTLGQDIRSPLAIAQAILERVKPEKERGQIETQLTRAQSIVDANAGTFTNFTENALKYSQCVRLGLAILRTVAVEQGGQVRLENRPEGGLRAVVKIPSGQQRQTRGFGLCRQSPSRRLGHQIFVTGQQGRQQNQRDKRRRQ